MQKLIFVPLLFISTLTFSQRSRLDEDHENFFRIGAKAGVNVNKISGQSYKSGFNYNYQLGGFMQFNFSRRFGLQPEVNFVQSSSDFTNDANDVYNDIFRDGTQKQAKLNSLEFPLLLNINIGLQSKRLKLQIGPAYGNVTRQTIDSLKDGTTSLYRSGEWSAIGGIFIQLPFFNIGARYKYGLSNINNIDNRQRWNSQAIQVFAGVTF
jgi:hypothetical protein